MDSPLLGFGTVKISPGLCELDKNCPCVVCLRVLKLMAWYVWK